MVTNRPAITSVSAWRLVRGGGAIVVSAVTLTSVYAGGVGNMNFVAAVIASSDEDAPAFPMCALCQGLSATRRERKPRRASADGWRNAGQRGIRRDPYGVARYIYAARGCEYGVGAD